GWEEVIQKHVVFHAATESDFRNKSAAVARARPRPVPRCPDGLTIPKCLCAPTRANRSNAPPVASSRLLRFEMRIRGNPSGNGGVIRKHWSRDKPLRQHQ